MPPEDNAHYVFLCNGAKLTSRKQMWKSAQTQNLSTGKAGNVEIKIKDIYDQLSANVPERAADLMEIAGCVYVADQLAKRSGNKAVDYGDLWYRHFRFEIAVRDPEFWQAPDVTAMLTQMLSFLSGDNYEFAFSLNPSPSPSGDYLEFRAVDPNPEGIDRVVMFSGGLDSLAGAVNDILVHKRKVALVSHKSVGHIAGIQNKLVEALTRKAEGHSATPTHIPVWARKRGLTENDSTQRSRSFLYVTLGAVVANLYGISTVDFYENGVVSVNLPLAQHTLGGRATRTTHPQTMALFRGLLSLVFDKDFSVRNEFIWDTKQDVVERIDRAGHSDLIDRSVSCSYTRKTSHTSPHCGMCSQCISRRFAALGVKNGAADSASRYRADVMTAPRTRTEDRTIAERFLGLAKLIERMESAGEFQQEYAAEMGRITPFLNESQVDSIDRIFDLHKRHATQVGDVIRTAMKNSVDAFHRGELSDGCPVMLAFKQGVGPTGDVMAKANDKADPTPFIPTQDQLYVLRAINQSPSLVFQSDIEAGTDQLGHRISRKTISKILRELLELDLIEYPRGERKGVGLMPAGRQVVANAGSH